ncbi:hypothetical protein Hdeb2414_s0007g00238271 [Helianthus debilis subsp. tardiflorus]
MSFYVSTGVVWLIVTWIVVRSSMQYEKRYTVHAFLKFGTWRGRFNPNVSSRIYMLLNRGQAYLEWHLLDPLSPLATEDERDIDFNPYSIVFTHTFHREPTCY